MYLFSVTLSMQPTTENLWITKLAERKKIGPTKYKGKKNLDPRNTHKKNLYTNKTPKRKTFVPTKYVQEKVLDPPSSHEKIFGTYEANQLTDYYMMGTLAVKSLNASNGD